MAVENAVFVNRRPAPGTAMAVPNCAAGVVKIPRRVSARHPAPFAFKYSCTRNVPAMIAGAKQQCRPQFGAWNGHGSAELRSRRSKNYSLNLGPSPARFYGVKHGTTARPASDTPTGLLAVRQEGGRVAVLLLMDTPLCSKNCQELFFLRVLMAWPKGLNGGVKASKGYGVGY